MYKSVILPHAKEDIREAALWYNKQSNELGNRFMDEVRGKIHNIKQNPKTCSIRYDNVRTTVLKVFPFMIHYTIDKVNKSIVISAVLHTSRNPKLWKRK